MKDDTLKQIRDYIREKFPENPELLTKLDELCQYDIPPLLFTLAFMAGENRVHNLLRSSPLYNKDGQ